ncbi:hypothetical protein PPL19_05385 [Pseudomonas psychrotolerans L19]|uniref:hypothetical protein n=1 Tax=Pseudomonas oryzihabitans TaxID=47885 RepID=UPI00023A2A7E|nr:hypothetical protein [Pseudomonas psychrotolerans]EHK72346.1 hypothetical protein PPL19_05385 [Pseudomonas psychrotolerans L19]
MTILVQQLRAEIEQLQAKIVQLEKSLKLVQSHATTAYNRGRQAGIAGQERTAREAIAAMDLARDQMMDENERFTDLLEKAEQERDQLKAESAELRQDKARLDRGYIMTGVPGVNACVHRGVDLRAAIDRVTQLDEQRAQRQAMTKEQP